MHYSINSYSKCLLLAALAVVAGFAQAPRFEVASIKRSAPGARPGYIRIAPGGERYIAVHAPFRFMIQDTYHLRKEQLAGGDEWIYSDLYDINAEADGPQSVDVMRAMFRDLLAERFKLQFHLEAKEGPVYALVQDKGGAKLRRHDAANAGEGLISTTGDPNPGQDLKQKWHAVAASMNEFAWMLSEVLDRPVIDKTGLTGGYDFDIAFTMPWPAGIPEGSLVKGVAIDTSGPAAFDVVRAFGLKLEPQRGPVEVMKIDRAERPAEN
jgi:uncharacterized protein (TIGR03435 family)